MSTETPNSLDLPSPDRPLLIYDGESRICRASIDRWHEATDERIQFVPFQEAEARLPQIGDDERPIALCFVSKNGTVSRGAEAVLQMAAYCGRRRWLLRLYQNLPPLAFAAKACYRLAAVSRGPRTVVRRIWYGNDLKPPTYHIATALFLRLLGLVYLIAFVSLWTQIDGLIGDHGILPVTNYLDAAKHQFAAMSAPVSPVWNLPTLAWINAHNGFLHLLCAAGTLLSILLVLGLLPLPSLVLLWLAYLSLFHAGQEFLGFQWDILLLETGAVAIFMAPWTLRWRWLAGRHPPRIAIWLVWWLLFRLMFESGAVKLTWSNWQLGPDGSPVANTWRSLTALDFHYWTQPLPIWTSWYAAKLPEWFQKLSVSFVFVVELGLPWLIFGPRLLRYLACGGITLLMLLIAATSLHQPGAVAPKGELVAQRSALGGPGLVACAISGQ
jgi:predicted DCC family thiol-disulfide oxidoreductase YuxK